MPTATAEQIDAIAKQMNSRLAASLVLRHEGWFKFFKLMDDDDSGRIAYAELARGLRQELGLGKKEVADAQLQGLWKALDEDASGFISAGEFLRFVKRGSAALPEAEQSQWVKTRQQTRQRVNAMEVEWESGALVRARQTRQHVEQEAAKLEAMLVESRAAKAKGTVTKAAKATFLTGATSNPSLPPINPHAARSVFVTRSDRFGLCV